MLLSFLYGEITSRTINIAVSIHKLKAPNEIFGACIFFFFFKLFIRSFFCVGVSFLLV